MESYYSLSFLGLSAYLINEKAQIYSLLSKRNLAIRPTVSLKTDNGTTKNFSLKKIYFATFGKHFAVDKIQSFDGEQWEEVKETCGKYYASTCGRIKSYARFHAIILQDCDNGNGYRYVLINGKPQYVHRLVGEAFIDSTDEKAITIDHIDAHKENNSLGNLQWLSQGDNVRKHFGKPLQKDEK